MYPVYQFMDSFPRHMNQMHSTPHHHPHLGCYQAWPHHPANFHSCSDPIHYQGYFAPRPPCTPVPPHYYPGSYPVPASAYPVCYNCPPHYATKVPHYRHSGDMSGYGHCCGCPNHPYYKRKDRNNLNIEDWDFDSLKKSDDPVSSLDSKSHPSPVLGIPPGFVMNTPEVNLSDSQPAEKDKHPGAAAQARERSKPSEEQKNFLDRWLPLIIDNSGSTKQGGDAARQQEHQDEEKRQFPFPLLWMPYNLDDSMEKKDNVKTNAGEKCMKENPEVMVLDAEDKKNAPKVNEVMSHETLKPSEKNNVQKAVPVKSVESAEERKIHENNEDKMKSSSSKHVNGTEGTESSQGPRKSKSSSPLKSTKLPPICLRVDPVQKKKNGHGGSRSPSPPGDREKLHESTRNGGQSPATSNAKEAAERDMTSGKCVEDSTKEAGYRERKVKTIEVSDGTTRRDGIEDPNLASAHGSESRSVESHAVAVERKTNDKSAEAYPVIAAQEVNMNARESNHRQGTVVGKSIDSTDSTLDVDVKNPKVDGIPANKGKENGRLNLSEDEAAIIIQSAYRGYEVRRWEPLKKLKQIGDVREEVVKLSDRIEAMKLSSYSQMDQDDKWRIAIEESIMNLLLKLDTIQGLHPGIRDIRKSVARELVSLQEKIDCITRKRSEVVHELDSADKFEKDRGEEEVSGQSSPLITENVHGIYPKKLCESVTSPVSHSNCSCLEIPKTVRDDEDTGASMLPVTEALAATNKETSETGLKLENEARNASQNFIMNGDQEHSTEFSLPQVSDDEDTGASSLEAAAESLGASTVERNETTLQSENEARNASNQLIIDDQGLYAEVSLAWVKNDEDTVTCSLEPVAESLKASPVENNETSLQSENESTNASEILVIGRGDQEHHTEFVLPQVFGDHIHSGDDEIASSVMDEVSGLKEVAESPEGHCNLQDIHLLPSGAGNDKSLQGEIVMENNSKVDDSTQKPDDDYNVEDSSNDARIQGNDGTVIKDVVNMDFNAEQSNDEDLDVNQTDAEQSNDEVLAVNQTEEMIEVKVTAPEKSEVNDNLVSQETGENRGESSVNVDVGSCEIPLEEETRDDSEVHDKFVDQFVAEMESDPFDGQDYQLDNCSAQILNGEQLSPERSITSSEAQSASQRGSALSDVKISPCCKDKTALISESDASVEVFNCSELENDQKLLDKIIEMQASEVAAKDDKLLVHPCGTAAVEKDSAFQMNSAVLDGKDVKEGELACQSSLGNDGSTEFDKKLIEENEKLREIMQKLIEAGNEQLAAISNLSGRVKDLEKKLGRKKKLKVRGYGTSRYPSRMSCMKPSTGALKERAMPRAM